VYRRVEVLKTKGITELGGSKSDLMRRIDPNAVPAARSAPLKGITGEKRVMPAAEVKPAPAAKRVAPKTVVALSSCTP
jgi:hypothetical protein